MKKEDLKINEEDTMREEYDFDYSKAVWGKSAKKLLEEGANIVVIQPDVFAVFPDSASVNEALRPGNDLSPRRVLWALTKGVKEGHSHRFEAHNSYFQFVHLFSFLG